MTTNSELWSLYGDLTGTATEEDRFRRIQRYQKAHSCLAQKPGAEKHTELAKQMLEIAVKVRSSLGYFSCAIGVVYFFAGLGLNSTK